MDWSAIDSRLGWWDGWLGEALVPGREVPVFRDWGLGRQGSKWDELQGEGPDPPWKHFRMGELDEA